MSLNQIFISYEWRRKEFVYEIAKNLETISKHQIWIDREKILAGNKLHESIQNGINNSETVLAFVTLAYCESDNCQLEIQFANRIKKKQNKKIIYIVLEHFDNVASLPNGMGVLLTDKLCFNAYEPEWTEQNMEHYIGKLVEAIQKIKNDKSVFVSLLRIFYIFRIK